MFAIFDVKDWLATAGIFGGVLGAVSFAVVIWMNQGYEAAKRIIETLRSEVDIERSRASRYEKDYKEAVESSQRRLRELTEQHKAILDTNLAEYQKLQQEYKDYRDDRHAEQNKFQAILIENAELKAYNGPVWRSELQWRSTFDQAITDMRDEMGKFATAIIQEIKQINGPRTSNPNGPSKHSDL